MTLFAADKLQKVYGDKVLVREASFSIEEGQKIGLIGLNGAGKSTLLKILAGYDQADAGQMMKKNGLLLEYLSQDPVFGEEKTVLEQVFAGHSPDLQLLRDYEQALKHCDTEEGTKRLMALSAQVEERQLWQLESQAKQILTKLQITDFEQPVKALSGGQRKRVALAGALVRPSDLLILDEPTNHLDQETIGWLEQFLISRKGAVLMVTHDRYFLDRVATIIFELDRGEFYRYEGNYSYHLDLKAERLAREKSTEAKRQALYRQELAWIRQGAPARSTKQKARIDRFEALGKSDYKEEAKAEIQATFSRLGRTVIEVNKVTKSWDQAGLTCPVSHVFNRHERIGLIGPNGCGKTTFLNLLAGRLEPDTGEILQGQTVKIGYFSQDNREMPLDLRVMDYLTETGQRYVQVANGSTISASQLLEQFLFPRHEHYKPLAKLSGGEKRRLYLLRILMEAPNVLLLDEPTNDLDTETLTVLEDYLQDFPGLIVTVSHDRYFLDKCVNQIWAFEEGGFVSYPGHYSDYARRKSAQAAPNSQSKEIESKNSVSGAAKPSHESKAAQLKLTLAEEKEYSEIEGVIAELEGELKMLAVLMARSADDYDKLQPLLQRNQEVETLLTEKMNRWACLAEKAEQ